MKHAANWALALALAWGVGARPLEPSHSFANPQDILVKNTALDLIIDFDEKVLRGTAQLSCQRLKGRELWLDTSLLTIQSISGDIESWELKVDPAISKMGLGEALVIKTKDQEQIAITIAYETSPKASGLIWMDAQQTRSGEPLMFAMNEPIGARSWFPCQDTPAVRGTYSANLRIVAKNSTTKHTFMALISGENNPRESNDAMNYEGLTCTKAPIPSYLFVLAAGPFTHVQQDATIGYYADNREALHRALVGLKDVPQYFAALKGLLGDSPWPRHDFLLIPPLPGFGGMENPMLIYLNEQLVDEQGTMGYITAHELAHMWTGNLVTNEHWGAFWLNEGWTSYYEDRVLEALYGKEFAEANAFLTYQDLVDGEKERLAYPKEELSTQPTRLQKMRTDDSDPRELMDLSVYAKGSSMLHTIEEIIGREEFDNYAKDYINTFRFKPLNSRLFIDFSVAKLGALHPDIQWSRFFEEWIFKPGLHPDAQQLKIPRIYRPQCKGCDEKLHEFAVRSVKTDFKSWNRFQLFYLLRILEREINDGGEEASKDRLAFLLKNQSFLDSILLQGDLRSYWYKILVKAGIRRQQNEDIFSCLA